MLRNRLPSSRRSRGTIAVSLVAAVAVVGAACNGDGNGDDAADDAGTTTAPTSETTSTTTNDPFTFAGDFYDVPDPLPDGPAGTLIRAEPVEVADLREARLLRVMYLSESVQGDPIAVTGLVLHPTGEPPAGGRPVVSWAHGSTGIADHCAPSKEPTATTAAPFATAFLERGWVVVATDYEGLGTPGRHPYIVGESEARGVIDIVRAARELDGAGASERYVTWGHSQGGHAALFTGEIAGQWAPELELAGVVAGAPPSELTLIGDALRDGPFQGYVAMVAVAFAAAYPEAEEALDEALPPRARELLPVVDEGCTGEILETFQQIPYDELVTVDPTRDEPWATLLAENNPGTRRFEAPLLIIHGSDDEQIPVIVSEIMHERMCELGQVSERRVYEGANHAGVIEPSFDDMLTWIEARFAGEPASAECPSG